MFINEENCLMFESHQQTIFQCAIECNMVCSCCFSKPVCTMDVLKKLNAHKTFSANSLRKSVVVHALK